MACHALPHSNSTFTGLIGPNGSSSCRLLSKTFQNKNPKDLDGIRTPNRKLNTRTEQRECNRWTKPNRCQARVPNGIGFELMHRQQSLRWIDDVFYASLPLRHLANLKRSHDQGVCIFEKHHWWTPNNTFANRRKGLQAYQHPKRRMRHATLRDITHMQKFNIRLRKIAESQNSSACTSNPCIILMRCLGLDRCLVMIWGRTYTTQAGTECWYPRHSCKTACHMSVYYCKITRISDYCLFLLFILG